MSYCHICSGSYNNMDYTFGGKYNGGANRADTSAYDNSPLAGTITSEGRRVNARMWNHVNTRSNNCLEVTTCSVDSDCPDMGCQQRVCNAGFCENGNVLAPCCGNGICETGKTEDLVAVSCWYSFSSYLFSLPTLIQYHSIFPDFSFNRRGLQSVPSRQLSPSPNYIGPAHLGNNRRHGSSFDAYLRHFRWDRRHNDI